MLRFAPSPTGPLHLGGLRTALLNALYAKKIGGKLILRIEDTDQSRCTTGSLQNIKDGLEWAGIHYDYGPERAGPNGPYFQSQRLDVYRHYANKLLEENSAYRCFCTPDELNNIRARLVESSSSLTYDRTCQSLTEEEVKRRLRLGHKHVVRFNLKENKPVNSTNDLIFGWVGEKRSSVATDPIIMKSDGFPTYHLASVVDDHAMQITHVIRGEEWLPSLALHLDLNGALGFECPTFAHLPILLNPDGTKMSKRHGDVRVTDYMERGWEPSAIKVWLLAAGWKGLHQSEIDPEMFERFTSSSADIDTLTRFDLSNYNHRRTILEPTLLEHLNKKYLQRQDPAKLAARYLPEFQQRFPSTQLTTSKFSEVIKVMLGRCITINDIADAAPYFFVKPNYNSSGAGILRNSIPDNDYVNAINTLRSTCNSTSAISSWPSTAAQEYNGSKKYFWSSVRHALAGQKDGPPLVKMLELLGPTEVNDRLDAALAREQKSMRKNKPILEPYI